MSFHFEGIALDQLKKLWPTMINDKLSQSISIKLEKLFVPIFGSESDASIAALNEFIYDCCNHKMVNFEEYISFVMITASIALLNCPELCRTKKSQLVSHTFTTNTTLWSYDQEKVVAVAESIQKVSSKPSNLNHIILMIHGYNQFTFNVSFILLKAALGNLAAKKTDGKMQLVHSDAIFEEILKLNCSNEKNAKHLYDFLTLFQSYQRIVCSPAARDKCLQELITFQQEQHLVQLEKYLKKTTESLNKTIRDQQDLNLNTRIVHMIQLVLNNMEKMVSNLPAN